MRFVDIPAPGGPEALILAEGPAPEPQPGEVLIRVAAAGINRPDVRQRQGSYPPPLRSRAWRSPGRWSQWEQASTGRRSATKSAP